MPVYSWLDLPLNQISPEKSNRIFKGEKVKVVFLKLKPGFAGVLHRHPQSEQLSHILRGEVKIKLGEEEWLAKAGDLILIPVNLPHTIVTCIKEAEILEIFSPPDYEKIPVGGNEDSPP